ncbi:MAG: carboxylesterase family protein [Firmicutes bacterium]|nr:carboxylesterase family protein [Bacillota bacterium]
MDEAMSELMSVNPDEVKAAMRALYGENKQITDDNYDKSLAVKCINGTFVGKETDGIIAYKGIPFVGRQPVGDLRWKAPVDCAPDDGVYEAYYNGKSPCQVENPEEPASVYVQGEDCLYLNIWKAKDPSEEKKPVMVWIHGGAFELDGTVDPLYECHNFIQENPDVIVVSIAYRLGVLGFFHLSHLPDGKDYPDAQNVGLMDQVMALKWVHENIAAFGGDPNNVTIWGESAGGASVSMLPLIEGAQQYFKRVIAQSGAPSQMRSTEDAIARTKELMDALGCETVSDLRNVDGRDLAETAGQLWGFYTVLEICLLPERDGKYLPLDPFDAYGKGAAKDIEFLQGCNKDEMDVFAFAFGEENWKAWCADRKARILAKLTDDEKKLVESFEDDGRLVEQNMFVAPQIRLSEEQTRGGGKSYTYLFTPESVYPGVGCGHASELATVFALPEYNELAGREFDETFAKTMRKMWVQFAKTGNPSLSAEISPDGKAKEWPLYDLEDKNVMILDEFNIHPEKESERKIVDWERTYFLTNYYMI